MLKEIIVEEIRRKGFITFDRFVELSLYHPGFGYYTSKRVKPVPGEDFITSPELSSAFGRTVALWIEEASMRFGIPLNILEPGGGKGFLAKEIMASLNVENYTVLERNLNVEIPGANVIGSLDEVKPFRGFIISNELFDAFPFKRIKKLEGKLFEVVVKESGGKLFEDLIPAGENVHSHFELIGCELEEGCEYSLFTGYDSFLKKLGEKLAEGVFLTFDYGWECRELMNRKGGTLRTFRGHRVGDNPYEDIGKVDITSDVDFTYLKTVMKRYFRSVEVIPQSKFLLNAGIDKIGGEVPEILTLIVEMGRRFKAVTAFKGGKFEKVRG